MDYYGIGYSNIRLPNSSKSYIYRYNSRINTFPEEVFVHEFLHSLERNLTEKGYTFPALHDNEMFGYENQNKTGLKDWYRDYMRCNIDSNVGKTGLDQIVYKTKPIQLSDFNYAHEIEFENVPHNIIDIVSQIISNFKQVMSKNSNSEINETNYVTITTD